MLTNTRVQIANIDWKIKINEVVLVNTVRLIISPVLALMLILLFDITGVVAQVLVISSAVPTALNVVFLAIEYDNEPGFASKVVLSSTILSLFSITLVIYLVKSFIT